jgi:hypothetical protein
VICVAERVPGAGIGSAVVALVMFSLAVPVGGWTYGGIVPDRVRIVTPGPVSDMAARKVPFMPPFPPLVSGAVGVPRWTSSAVWKSS